MTGLAARVPEIERLSPPDQVIACEIFGWVRGTPRVAINVWTVGTAGAWEFFRGYFLDVSSWTFSDARQESARP